MYILKNIKIINLRKKHKKRKHEREQESDSDYEESQIVIPPVDQKAIKNEPEIISSVKTEDLPEVPTTNKFLMRRYILYYFFISSYTKKIFF
jgi:hypothetical protein